MAAVDRLWLATLTKNEDDAGTDANRLNLTINVDGEDIVDMDLSFLRGQGFLSGGHGPDSDWLGEGQGALAVEDLPIPIETSLLTNSSIRLGIRTDDAWGPQHVLLLGRGERRVIPIAMETDLDRWLSTDSSEGKLTMPLRLVREGTSSTLIRRVLLLVYTESGADVETDSPIELTIVAAGNTVVDQTIPDTPQDDLEEYTANWYPVHVDVPFTRGDVLSNGEIRLGIGGTDAWLPKTAFVYGLDTKPAAPTRSCLWRPSRSGVSAG
ncbi:MAG TPA: hypothetical protein VIL18_09080 [Longimicrobiales bacterium]